LGDSSRFWGEELQRKEMFSEEEEWGRALGRLKMIGKTSDLSERKECFLGNAQMNGLSLCWTEKIF